MATEMITLKMDSKLLREVDETVKKGSYQNRTEFIRSALREKISEARLKEAMIELSKLKGASKKKTSDEKLERIREMAFEEIDRKIR